ncbi:glycosyltransferase family 2 protein [Patescibacteria group bacterium]|nr:glycosyltransferase family 2 protein [Patescibacteria group bacterium]MBU1970330.1 glycosyltransferase family 2 protein [Patescibacteria group bacterium]
MRVSILIPCHNEEKSIKSCIEACLNQTRPADEIIVVDDGSKDGSATILEQFGSQIKVVKIVEPTGNKSYVQQRGLDFVTGDVFIATDGDTILDKNFVHRMCEDFKDEKVAAVAGYVKSLRHNWLTACREIDYAIGQDLHKTAQSYINFLFVIPGCAGAFRTNIFKKHISFDHDTLTEDLDFTYKLNEQYFAIKYDKKAIVYTQDPANLKSYIKQLRRWYGGGWQNLQKHFKIARDPIRALELSLMYVEGVIFSAMLLILPLVNINFLKFTVLPTLAVNFGIGLYAALSRKRIDLILGAPLYVLLVYVNAYVFTEQFVSEVLLKRRSMAWFHPERRAIAWSLQ